MGDVILQSGSWEKGGEPARERHLEKVMEQAGYEVEKEPPPPPKPDFEKLPGHEQQRLVQKYGQAVDKTIAKVGAENWKNAVDQEIHIGTKAQAAILQEDNAPEICYYLGRNPEEARRLGKMKGTEAVKEVRRISSKLTNEERRNVRPPENASFEEIVATRPYWGRARDIRRALRRR
jgi:hypothetical protein